MGRIEEIEKKVEKYELDIILNQCERSKKREKLWDPLQFGHKTEGNIGYGDLLTIETKRMLYRSNDGWKV